MHLTVVCAVAGLWVFVCFPCPAYGDSLAYGTPMGNGYTGSPITEGNLDDDGSIDEPVRSSSFFGGLFGPKNYWECILKHMPGVATDLVAGAVREKCMGQFPSMSPPKKKDGGVFARNDALDCVVKYGKNTASERGAKVIRTACYKLYSKN